MEVPLTDASVPPEVIRSTPSLIPHSRAAYIVKSYVVQT